MFVSVRYQFVRYGKISNFWPAPATDRKVDSKTKTSILSRVWADSNQRRSKLTSSSPFRFISSQTKKSLSTCPRSLLKLWNLVVASCYCPSSGSSLGYYWFWPWLDSWLVWHEFIWPSFLFWVRDFYFLCPCSRVNSRECKAISPPAARRQRHIPPARQLKQINGSTERQRKPTVWMCLLDCMNTLISLPSNHKLYCWFCRISVN